MKKLFFLLMLPSLVANAQTFEGGVPETIQSSTPKTKISVSDAYYKDGEKSLRWDWSQPESTLTFSDEKILKTSAFFSKRAGLKLWVFNEKPCSEPLKFFFKDAQGQTQYVFSFYLDFYGWRAAWIAYADMWTSQGGKTSPQPITTMEIRSPKGARKGTLWFDRLEFSASVDKQATPDAQIPENNRNLTRDIWHWGLLHKWEKQKNHFPLPEKLSPEQQKNLQEITNRLWEEFPLKPLQNKEKEALQRLWAFFRISPNGKKGAPLVHKDHRGRADATLIELNDLLSLSARDWLTQKNQDSKKMFVTAVRYMLYQGFAYESGMGTNHHYGYDIRDIFMSAWRMKPILEKEKLWAEVYKTLTYWSGLQEIRQEKDSLRDEIADTWNTLLIPRLQCALMAGTEQERWRNLEGLSHWVNASLHFTPGTIGGLKVDGTAFHHGGHYPAYAVPGYASLGQYIKMVNRTPFSLSNEAFKQFKFALQSLVRQTNLRDWGVAACGRHPMNEKYGSISKKAVLAFAYAAQVPSPTDSDLAEDFLRLCKGISLSEKEKSLVQFFENQGIKEAQSPQGFFVFNYASLGVYRYGQSAVLLKGFSRNIWGAEIYAKDNRYGRYQSYGSMQILGKAGDNGVITEKSSGYEQSGWDWNHNPGTTAIVLPFELLESPFSGSDMLRQPNTFSGASSLEQGKYGMFAMTLGELRRKNFTPSFTANKSVFCFENRLVCLGSSIGNDREEFPTHTTLFQQKISQEKKDLTVQFDKNFSSPVWLKDPQENYYFVPSVGMQSTVNQNVSLSVGMQESRNDKTKKPTQGAFVTAYINHGKAPKEQAYQYMVLLNSPETQKLMGDVQLTDSVFVKASKKLETKHFYTVLKQDGQAHIVRDEPTQTHAYAFFESTQPQGDLFVIQGSAHCLLMLRKKEGNLYGSLCSPDLNLGKYQYTTAQPSQPVCKEIILRGKFVLSEPNTAISLSINKEGNTELKVQCVNGIPVEFLLQEIF